MQQGLRPLRTRFFRFILNNFGLGPRPKPDFRSDKGWKTILDTFYESCANRLKDIHTSTEIFIFAGKCFEEQDFKEKCLVGAAAICAEHAIPFEVQASFVHADTESADFERSAQAAAGLFNRSFNSVGSDRSIDLAEERVSTSAFQVALSSSDQVLDLD